MQTYDVLVVGAGIVGCACALECTRAGLRVGVVEMGVPAGAATAAGMGHVVAMDDSPAQLALSRYSQTLWQELRPTLPAAAEYEETGTLWLAADEEEMAEVKSKQQRYAAAGIRTAVLDAVALTTAEPNLRGGLAGALLVPEDGVLYPPAAAGHLLGMARLEGATLLRGSTAVSAGRGGVSLADGSMLAASSIIVATGTDCRLLPSLPIHKRKGHLVITDRYPGFVRHQLVELGYLKSAHKTAEDSVAFNIQPRQTGQLLIGSSRQYGAEETTAEHSILDRMLVRAQEYMPGLADLSVLRVWTGFRAATPDKLPYIGPTEDPSVFAATGFEGLGITHAPGAARLVVDHLLGRVSAIDPVPYLPSRTLVSEAKYV